ncbi:MAG: hypothetical protein CVV45_05585 [Spirochaetae bacterium HGW-Spirochaetae-10]|nr:MAG: hypothetical protein CVV45_05585 [Spirochaetae bacterium HGW-Spirochaetae-10]
MRREGHQAIAGQVDLLSSFSATPRPPWFIPLNSYPAVAYRSFSELPGKQVRSIFFSPSVPLRKTFPPQCEKM